MREYNGFEPALRKRANQWIARQVELGLLRKPSKCCACGNDAPAICIDYHVEDYSEPFGPHTTKYAVCFACHMMIHCRFKFSRAWQNYVSGLREGRTYPAFKFRSWPRFKELFLEGRAPFVIGQRRDSLIFDRMGLDGGPLSDKPVIHPKAIKPEYPKEEQPTLL